MTEPVAARAEGPDVDLLVVGFGPTGAVLAGLAAGHGLRVAVVERNADMFPLPRAVQCDHEVLRILQELGCADEVMAGIVVNDGMDLLSADRKVLQSFSVPPMAATGWPASVFFHQPTFESILRRCIGSSGVDIRLGHSVTSLHDHGSGVDVGMADGTTIRAGFVVGCDGARSTVRTLMGASMTDTGFEEAWLVVDLLLRGPAESLPSRCLQVCDPARPHTLVPMPPPRFRMEFMLLPGETPEEIQAPDRIAGMVSSWIDPELVEVERGAVYTFHGLVASAWRKGRTMLAGDAAHQMPPFLGQGMCAGMRDASNLAWKLGAVIRGEAPEDLLDTYQAEREPHVQTVIDAAVGFGRLICLTDPVAAAERDASLSALRLDDDTAPELIPPLLPGPAIGAGGGALTPQPTVGGVRFDDMVGPRLALCTAQPLDPGGSEATWWSEHGIAFDAATHPELLALLSGEPACAIRPDRYVLARGTPEEVTAAAARVIGTP